MVSQAVQEDAVHSETPLLNELCSAFCKVNTRLHAHNFLISHARNYNFHVLPASFLTHASTLLPSASFVSHRFNIPLSLSLSAHLHQYIYSFNWNTDKKIYCSEQTQEFHFEAGLVVCLQGTKALAVPLVTNTSILSLNLRDNWMEGMGGAAIAEMLKENCYITGGFSGRSRVHTLSLLFSLPLSHPSLAQMPPQLPLVTPLTPIICHSTRFNI